MFACERSPQESETLLRIGVGLDSALMSGSGLQLIPEHAVSLTKSINGSNWREMWLLRIR